jgi:uncharacterized membrane protein
MLVCGLLAGVSSVFADVEGVPPPQQDVFEKGKIVDIVEEYESDQYGLPMFVQELHVEVLSGPDTKRTVSVIYEVQPIHKDVRALSQGDRVILGKQPGQGIDGYYISDVYRIRVLWWIVGFFMLIGILFARMYAIRAFVGLLLSFGVIGYVMIPQILAGANPVLVSLVGTVGIATVSLYIAHGFRTRTTIAFVSTIITIGIAVIVAWLFVHATKLFGMGSEDALFLQYAPIGTINLQGLLLGGIIIGMLGVLDDITTAQSATVEEIHLANRTLSRKELYERGSSVGREHITSLINTLVLAYTGASLPLLLLFRVYERPFWVTLNSEIVMEEVIRMLAGSVALILAVPITTYLAAWWFGRETDEVYTKQ